MDCNINMETLHNLMSEVNLENSLVTANLESDAMLINNICVDRVYIDKNDIIFTGRRSAFIDALLFQINNMSNLDIEFNENEMKYSLIQKDSRVDFYIHT